MTITISFRKRLVVCAALFISALTAVSALTLNYDINTSSSGNYAGTAIAPDSGTQWNSAVIPGNTSIHQLTSVVDSTGNTLSGVEILYESTNGGDIRRYSAGSPGNPTPQALMQDYTYGGSYRMTISGLPEGSYLLYVFAHGDQADQAGTITVDPANGGGSGTTGTSGDDYRNIFLTSAEGYAYLKFDNVVVDANGTLIFSVANFLNGFQLISAPPPVIATHPSTNLTGYEGGSVSLSVDASSAAPLSYQWQKTTVFGEPWADLNPIDYPSANSATLTFSGLLSDDAGFYRVVVSTAGGSVASTFSILTVESSPGPQFSQHPESRSIERGESVTFTVETISQSTVTYQWFKGEDELPGETGTSLTITDADFSDAGYYRVEATDDLGTKSSNTALLRITVPLPAFPGADGPGSMATGGRGGEVYHVTNLNDNGPGSLRDAISQSNRTVVFDVSGLIFLDPANSTSGWLRSSADNLTIAGETAPYPGITIAGQGTKFDGDNVIIRHLKIRPGKHQQNPGVSTHDGISNYLQNSIIDHVSISWADDETISSTDLVNNTTVQFSIFGEALYYNLQGGSPHAYGALINSEVSDAPLSYHHNLFTHIQSRLPRIQNEVDSGSTGAFLNWTNNVIYNWQGRAGYSGNNESTRTNFIGNYYIAGNNTRSTDAAFYGPDPATRLFGADNFLDRNFNSELDGTDPGEETFFTGSPLFEDSVFEGVDTPELDVPGTSVEIVTSRAGAFWWARDAVDTRLITDTLNQTGSFVGDPSEVGGWDDTGNARPEGFDSDLDGMSDAWEIAHGLDPETDDAEDDINRDGYSNLQNYLIDLGAFPLLSEAVWQGRSGDYGNPVEWSRLYLPSRFDTVVVADGKATVNTPGNWAKIAQVAPASGESAEIAIEENGWWYLAEDLTTGGAGEATISQRGGLVRLDGTLHLVSGSGSATYALSGGTLRAHRIEIADGGGLTTYGGTLHADTIVADNLVLNGSRLAPGTSPEIEILADALSDRALVEASASTLGTTQIEGDLTLSSGTLEIEIAGPDSFDVLEVTGTLALGGSLEIILLDDYRPDLGARFVVATADALNGSFELLPASFEVEYTALGEVILTYVGEASSYSDWAESYEFPSYNNDYPGADPDGDGWSNLEEFAFGGDPLVAATPAGVPAIGRDASGAIIVETNGAATVAFAHRANSDVRYRVETSDDLETWTELWTTDDGWEADAVATLTEGDSLHQLALNLGENSVDRIFVRVQVELTGPFQLVAPLGLTGAESVPTDIPPSLTFNTPVTAGTTGEIHLYEADGTLVSSIDLGANPRRYVGNDRLYYQPVITRGNTATIYFDRNLMDPGKTYYVTLDEGVLRDEEGAAWGGVDDAYTLRFTTRATAPASDAAQLTVDWDGSGDFCTVQGALEHIGNLLPHRVTVDIANGYYEELVYVSNQRGPVTLRGASREGVTIAYANNAQYNSNSRASFRNRTHDLTVENLSIINLTPKGGSQAEAFMSQGNRVVVRNCFIFSYQDTIRVDKSAYFEDCRIEGDVDYVWGDGVGYFENCAFHTLSGGYLVQARNEGANHGFIFNGCTLTGEPEAAGTYFARINPNEYPTSEVVFLNCRMDGHIAPVGWQLNNASSAPQIRFYEYQTVDLQGNPVNVSQRLADSTQIDATTAATYLDAAGILGFDPSER